MKAHMYQVGIALLIITPALAASPAEQRGKTFQLDPDQINDLLSYLKTLE